MEKNMEHEKPVGLRSGFIGTGVSKDRATFSAGVPDDDHSIWGSILGPLFNPNFHILLKLGNLRSFHFSPGNKGYVQGTVVLVDTETYLEGEGDLVSS